MADGTTANLGLVKMDYGSHRDDWGAVTNANLDKIDAAVDAAADKANAAVPKADNSGGYLRFASNTLTGGAVSIVPASGTDPTVNPGDIWLGY